MPRPWPCTRPWATNPTVAYPTTPPCVSMRCRESWCQCKWNRTCCNCSDQCNEKRQMNQARKSWREDGPLVQKGWSLSKHQLQGYHRRPPLEGSSRKATGVKSKRPRRRRLGNHDHLFPFASTKTICITLQNYNDESNVKQSIERPCLDQICLLGGHKCEHHSRDPADATQH
jgi:hypothetical protein